MAAGSATTPSSASTPHLQQYAHGLQSPAPAPAPSPTTDLQQYTHGLHGVNQIGNYVFINCLVGFLIGLGLCILCVRWTNMAYNHARHMVCLGRAGDKQTYWESNKTVWWSWTKQHILLAPIWNVRHNREIQLSSAISIGTLPSRFQAAMLMLYFISNIIYCFLLDYQRAERASLIAELRGRSGALASWNLIPTVLFAMRNNPLIPLLRISYDTFNLFHRYTARIVVIEAIIHATAWTVNAVEIDGPHGPLGLLANTTSFQWGMVGLSFFIFMATVAWSPIRHGFYEIFLTTHRLFAVVGLTGVYVHLDTGNLPQLPYIQAALLIYLSEWTIRTAGIWYYNWSPQKTTQITVQALANEACRVTVTLARRWRSRPGCHVHIYIPKLGLWSSHPFSIAWSTDNPSDEMSEKLPMHKSDAIDIHNHTSISLIIRARTGMTRKLFDAASASETGTITVAGFVEAPYGGHESLDSYGTVLFFAAGVGITHQIPYIEHLLRGYEEGTVATRKVILVWSVRNVETLEWIQPWMDQILRMQSRRHVLKVMLFVTQTKIKQEVISGTGTVLMFPGRCDPQAIIDNEMAVRVGAMIIQTCSNGSFADAVRAAARRRVQRGSLDFVEEAFTY